MFINVTQLNLFILTFLYQQKYLNSVTQNGLRIKIKFNNNVVF